MRGASKVVWDAIIADHEGVQRHDIQILLTCTKIASVKKHWVLDLISYQFRELLKSTLLEGKRRMMEK